MNTFVPMKKLEEMSREEVADFYEIWITTSESWPQDPKIVQRECLWRADRELTQDVTIEEVYFQNLPRLWLVVKSLNDSYVLEIERLLGEYFDALEVKGEFRPIDKPRVPAGETNNNLAS